MEGETRYVPAGSDYAMRVWDVETGQPLYLFDDHGGPVLDLALSSDRRHVLSAGGDGSLRLWKLSAP
jgi:WD40 repeat protein